MTVYYWKTKPNFGDRLTSLLIDRFTGLESEWAEPEEAQLVMIGSVLEHLPWDWAGVIAGAGKLHEETVLGFPNATVLAVRGRLTAKALGLENVVLGDPALLANELVPMADKEYDLGIIPHWTDNELEHNPKFTRFNAKVIRVGDEPLKVISEIGKCKRIVSSSLHGIILADAFGIARRIELAPRMLTHAHQEGGIFKWRDYSTSLKIRLRIGLMEQVDRNLIADKQSELFDVFERIKKIFSW